MGGGLMQLVAYGAQDVYLTGNPQITFFKVVYRRPTNFAMECIEQTLNGTVGYGNRLTATISRNGDLVHKMHFEVTPGTDVSDLSFGGLSGNYGHGLFKEIEVQIGGQRIDKHYSQWLQVWSELTQYDPRPSDASITQYQKMTATVGTKASTITDTFVGPDKILVPLQFWFNRNPGLALPLIALQYHEVKLVIDLASGSDFTAAPSDSFSLKLWVDYIYLDTDERRRFAQTSHEYLIEQLQFTGTETLSSGNSSLRLNFNHPVKELVWTVESASAKPADCIFNAPQSSAVAKLQLNGHDRFAEQDSLYFTRMQPWNHHSNIPANDVVSVYSFALKPEEHQPSGTCNFSRIDNSTLKLTNYGSGSEIVRVFAVNYNVLRVMSGMGGLAYSN